MGANPAFQSRLAHYEGTIADGQTEQISDFVSQPWARLTGLAISTHACTINVYQGSKNDAGTVVWHAKTALTLTASGGADGAGTGFSIESVGDHARVDIVNSAGGVAVVDFTLFGRVAS